MTLACQSSPSFESASSYGLTCQWEGVPEEAFMVLMIDGAAVEDVSGVARYRGEFDDAVDENG